MRQVPSKLLSIKNIHDFSLLKQANTPITMCTSYDYWTAKILNKSDIDCILVGDSVAMVVHGYPTTVNATVDMMATHTKAVAKGAPDKFIISDLPFCSYRKDLNTTIQAVSDIMQSGAAAVKLEGADDNLPTIKHIINSGVPVMGHIGLTPQSIYALGGNKVQGKTAMQAKNLLRQALSLQEAGCFAIVLECIPSHLGLDITQSLEIPTIGIGAGNHTSGQVLVLQDLTGMFDDPPFKFVKKYFDGHKQISEAINNYHIEVKCSDFPSKEHCFGE